jgi:hypothetical protein
MTHDKEYVSTKLENEINLKTKLTKDIEQTEIIKSANNDDIVDDNIVNDDIVDATIMATNPETGEYSDEMFSEAMKILNLKNNAKGSVWEKLFTPKTVYNGYKFTISRNDISNYGKEIVNISKYTLKQTGNKFFIDCEIKDENDEHTLINSLEVLAVHVRSGSMYGDGYRHVIFMSVSGSIYCGSGKDGTDKLSKFFNEHFPVYWDY